MRYALRVKIGEGTVYLRKFRTVNEALARMNRIIYGSCPLDYVTDDAMAVAKCYVEDTQSYPPKVLMSADAKGKPPK